MDPPPFLSILISNHLHAHLHAISGSARALFERALEMVAQHENIPLI